jgi:lysophospholipase L1-like esterase
MDGINLSLDLVRARLVAGQFTRIICFGDSITGIYYHTGSRRAWSHALDWAVRQQFPDTQLEVINAGVSGNNTTDALQRLDADVLAHGPHLVVMMFGINDVARSAPEIFRANLEELIQRIQSRDAPVLLLTPNSVLPGDPLRPPGLVTVYAESIRTVGRACGVPIVDAFQAFESVRKDRPATWYQLMSDAIHPNLRGHLIFAEETAASISGRHIQVPCLPPPDPGWPSVLARLHSGEEVNVIAMKPYDELIGTALHATWPGARVKVTSWNTNGCSLAEIEAQAKSTGWPRFRGAPTLTRPDLVILAVPPSATAPSPEQFYRSYTWVLNWSLDFGPPGWDYLVVLPSVANPAPDAHARAVDSQALTVVHGQDVPWLSRAESDASAASALLTDKVRHQLGLAATPACPTRKTLPRSRHCPARAV